MLSELVALLVRLRCLHSDLHGGHLGGFGWHWELHDADGSEASREQGRE